MCVFFGGFLIFRIVAVAVEGVSTVEEFADVAADIVLEEEGATGVCICVRGDVDDHIVEDNELFTIIYSFLEF